jgi:hypothetical protein
MIEEVIDRDTLLSQSVAHFSLYHKDRLAKGRIR